MRELLQGIGGSGKGSATDDEIRAFIDRGPSAFCSAFTRGDLMMPEPFVVQAIASFLTRCRVASTPCHAVDVGGNLGIHSAYMASLGASLDVVEPQSDLAAAIRRTMAANCWTAAKVRVRNRGITADDAADGATIPFGGGWRLDDRGMQAKRDQPSEMRLISLAKLLRGRTVDFLKVDIDNSKVEEDLMVALVDLIDAKEVDVRAFIFEHSTSRARGGLLHGNLTRALSRLQHNHGYHAYRLAHHLHSMDDPEPFYEPCVGARAFTFALHVKPLEPAQWLELLQTRRDQRRGRSDGLSIAWSAQPIGVGAEGRWRSASMDKTLPARWKEMNCGGAAAAGPPAI